MTTIAGKQNLNRLRNARDSGTLTPYFIHYNQRRRPRGLHEIRWKQMREAGEKQSGEISGIG